MNEVAMIDKNLSVERTPEIIAVEINSIKEQTRKIILFNSIEIGKRLAEAKIMLGHGEWGDWLKKSVNYSQRTASNLMGIFEQYGTSQLNMFCENNAKSQALASLSYTQAVLMMGIPMEEREAFIEEHDIHSKSTRELQQVIKDKQELEARLKEVEAGWEKDKKLVDEAQGLAKTRFKEAQKYLDEKQKAESEKQVAEAATEKLRDDLKEEKEKSKKEIERLELSISETKKSLDEAEYSGNTEDIELLSNSLVKANSELAFSLERIAELEGQLKDPIEVTAAPAVDKVPEEVERELHELREKNKELKAKGSQPVDTSTIRFKLHFDSLVNGFKDILSVLEEIDAEARGKYKNAVVGLIGKMSERL